MYNNELEVAKKAEQMLETSLRQKTSTFSDHIKRKEGDTSMKDATAKARVKQYKSSKSGKIYYMRSISIRMARHGFINHFGVNTLRAGGIRKRETPKSTTYSFKSHMMNQKPRPFINEAVRQSGVVDYVAEKIGESRAELLTNEITIGLRRDFI